MNGPPRSCDRLYDVEDEKEIFAVVRLGRRRNRDIDSSGDITEQEFRELSRRFSLPLREITKPLNISVLEAPAKNWAETVMAGVSVEHGLYSEYRQSNGGGYLLVFDRNHDHGYYRCSPR